MVKLLRQLGYLAAAALAGFYVFVALKGPHGVSAMHEKHDQIRRMEQGNETLRQEIRDKQEFLKRLDDDEALRERVIRERTNKQKPNETTIFLPEGDRTRR